MRKVCLRRSRLITARVKPTTDIAKVGDSILKLLCTSCQATGIYSPQKMQSLTTYMTAFRTLLHTHTHQRERGRNAFGKFSEKRSLRLYYSLLLESIYHKAGGMRQATASGDRCPACLPARPHARTQAARAGVVLQYGGAQIVVISQLRRCLDQSQLACQSCLEKAALLSAWAVSIYWRKTSSWGGASVFFSIHSDFCCRIEKVYEVYVV